MRAWDLAVFVIMIEMSIGFMSGLQFYEGIGGAGSLPVAQGGEVYRMQHENITETIALREPGIGDYLKFALNWVFASFNMMITIIRAFFFVSWDLYTVFHLPMTLCLFIQGIVYLIYTWGFIQWRSGRGGQAFE